LTPRLYPDAAPAALTRHELRATRDDDDRHVAAPHDTLSRASKQNAIEMPPAVRSDDDRVGALAARDIE
jgi:hypothetical protein